MPAEHNKLAHHYRLRAEKLEVEASDHAELATMYPARPNPCAIKRPMIPDTAAHCEYFAESFRKAASEARAPSAAHAEIAKKGVLHSFLRSDASLPNREPVVPSRGDIRETPGYRRPGQA